MLRLLPEFSIFVKMVDSSDQRCTSSDGGPNRRPVAAAPAPDGEFYSSQVTIPLRCNPLCRAPSKEIRERIERHNAGVLGFLLQGIDLEAMPRPTDERLAEALAPLRMKLDTLINMLARLSYRDTDLPPLCEAELGPNQIAWHSRQPWSPGEWLRIELGHSRAGHPPCRSDTLL
jgi:hypothetical protein